MEIELTSVVRYLTSVTHTRLYDNSSAQLVFRAEHLLQQVPITYRSAMDANALALLYVERAEFAKAQELLCRFAPKSADSMLHPVWHLLSCFTNGIRAHYMGLDEHALEQLTSARSKALQSGVRVLDSQILMMLGIVYLGHGNIVAARTILDEMSQHPVGRNGIRGYYYSNLLVSVLLREGNTGSALAGALQSLQICNSPGTVFEYASSLRVSAGARVKHGDIDGALDDIAKARALVTNSTSGIFHYLLNFTEAVVLTIKGDYSAALVALGGAIAIANKAGALVPPSYCQPEDVATLFSRALDSDVHTEFARRAIRNMNLPPPANYLSERWPWRYRIYTLGRFEIVKDGIPLRFEGKAQRRPLDLLKALIAFGGRNVSQEQLASVLWPDADGDAANASFTITLHRLRKLLGRDEVVIVENGELSLDARYLWVDAWAFERSVASIRGDSDQAEADAQANKVLSYYHGPFLANDSTSWAVPPRERLRKKFLQTVSVVAERHQQNGLWVEAAHWYERGIEVDALAEELYFKLMTCYQNLERRSDALAAYSRCTVALASAFQIQPTRKVQALFDVIRRSN
jgi:DNA-binding SARP family transcriptional activator